MTETEKITDFLKCPLISIIGNVLNVCNCILLKSYTAFQVVESSSSLAVIILSADKIL